MEAHSVWKMKNVKAVVRAVGSAKAHSRVACVDLDLLLKFPDIHSGFPKAGIEIPEDTRVEVLRGPVILQVSSGDLVDFFEVRFQGQDGTAHMGWVPASFLILR